MREIALDTETTGLSASAGDRIVEIGCVELIDHLPSGREFHVYLNPERPMHPDAAAVSGLTDAFLADKPLMAAVVDEFLAFIGDAPLVIHNASFDMGFINAELTRLSRPTLPMSRAIDTVNIARARFPGSPASLDALCKRFGIDLSSREKHGALIDARLLAAVYLELVGGRQRGFGLANHQLGGTGTENGLDLKGPARPRPRPLPSRLNEAEQAAHLAFIAGMGDKAIWFKKPAAGG